MEFLLLLFTLVDVRRTDDDEIRDERGEAGSETGLRHEAELELVEAHGLVVAPPIPSCEHIVTFNALCTVCTYGGSRDGDAARSLITFTAFASSHMCPYGPY